MKYGFYYRYDNSFKQNMEIGINVMSLNGPNINKYFSDCKYFLASLFVLLA